LTREQEIVEWKKMEDDPKQVGRSDFKGPSGAQRFRIKLGDFDSDVEELFEESEVGHSVEQKESTP